MSVAIAQDLASKLTTRECRGNGDLAPAMRRLEARYNLPKGLFYSLRYRPPKSIASTAFQSLVHAYRAECLRQAQLLEHELSVTSELVDDLDPDFIETVERLLQEVRGTAEK